MYLSWCHNFTVYFHRYGLFRLIDIQGLRQIMPVTLETFYEHVLKSSKLGAEILEREWLHECCTVVDRFRDDIEEMMPKDQVR